MAARGFVCAGGIINYRAIFIFRPAYVETAQMSPFACEILRHLTPVMTHRGEKLIRARVVTRQHTLQLTCSMGTLAHNQHPGLPPGGAWLHSLTLRRRPGCTRARRRRGCTRFLAVLAPAFSALVLAEGRRVTFLATASSMPVRAEGGRAAAPALLFQAIVLADGAASHVGRVTFLAPTFFPPVRAEVARAAVLAPVFLAIVLADGALPRLRFHDRAL